MKISNFKMIKVIGENILNREYFASVDVTEGFWIFKKTAMRLVNRKYASSWRFMDTGEFVPGYQVDNLAAANEAQQKFKESA